MMQQQSMQTTNDAMELTNDTMELNNDVLYYVDDNGVNVYGREDERKLLIETTNDGARYAVPLEWIKQYPFFNAYEDAEEDEELAPCQIGYVVNDEKELKKRVKEAIGVVGCKTMNLLIQYCGQTKLHGPRKTKMPEYEAIEDIEKYATEFEKKSIIDIDDDLLRNLVQDANYLGCEDFVKLLSALIATRIAGKSTDEMREYFEMPSNFTKEEAERVEEENAWIDQ